MSEGVALEDGANMAIKVLSGAVMFAALKLTNARLLAMGGVILGSTSLIDFLSSRQFTHLVFALCGVAAIVAGAWGQFRDGKFARQALEVQENRRLIVLIRENVLELEADKARSDDKLATLEVEHAQLCERYLISMGILADDPRRGPEPGPKAMPIERRRVLVVEDDHGSRHAMVRTLAARGFQVQGVSTVTEALDLIRARRLDGDTFDHVMIDVDLPDGSGLIVAREFLGTTVNLVVTTGLVDPFIEDAAKSLGAAFLAKPINVERLVVILGAPGKEAAIGATDGGVGRDRTPGDGGLVEGEGARLGLGPARDPGGDRLPPVPDQEPGGG